MIDSELTALLHERLASARAELMPMPLVPEIRLFLINEDFPQHALSREEMMAIMQRPTYWAFCWASGQVLARYLLDNPATVRGKTVVDIGCGSGVVAIAAALAGADRVIACDIDDEALTATAINARQNRVDIELSDNFDHIHGDIDVIVVADVLYDRENLPLLRHFLQRCETVLLADSRIRDFNYSGFTRLGLLTASTVPDLDESDEFRHVRLYRGGGDI